MEREHIIADDKDRQSLRAITSLLEGANSIRPSLVVGPGGEEIPLPESLLKVLEQAASDLARGRVVTLVSLDKALTTQQAADILNVSRPYFVGLLEQGKIPYVMTGTHRRVRFNDLMAYKRVRDAERREALAELTRLGEEMGDYDLPG